MEHPNRSNYVRLAELKTVVSFLVSCDSPISAYQVYKSTGISAGNLAWIVHKLGELGLVTTTDDTLIHASPDKTSIFALGRLLRLAKIKHSLDRTPDSMITRDEARELQNIPELWRLHKRDRD